MSDQTLRALQRRVLETNATDPSAILLLAEVLKRGGESVAPAVVFPGGGVSEEITFASEQKPRGGGFVLLSVSVVPFSVSPNESRRRVLLDLDFRGSLSLHVDERGITLRAGRP